MTSPIDDLNLPQHTPEQLKLMNALQFFAGNNRNLLDWQIDEAIKKAEAELEAIWQNVADTAETMSSEGFNDILNSTGWSSGDYREMHNNEIIHGSYLTDALLAMTEVKIIYAGKHLEIMMKRLIQLAYPDANIRNFFIWDKMLAFLEQKGIHCKTVSVYPQIIELREVYNTLKHSTEPEENIKSIPEFNGMYQLDSHRLQKFYSRIQDAPFEFIDQIANLIFDHHI